MSEGWSPVRRFRLALGLFIIGLVLSGITAFPLLTEIRLLSDWLGVGGATSPAGHDGLIHWLLTVRFGLENMYAEYPWIAYGTDWLAFGHLVIALFFIGPLIDPRSSKSNLLVGVVACIAVIPLALICGAYRGIPLASRLIDCGFGIIGLVPLLYCLHLLPVIANPRAAEDIGHR